MNTGFMMKHQVLAMVCIAMEAFNIASDLLQIVVLCDILREEDREMAEDQSEAKKLAI
jgi:hypothetical protein